MRCCECKRDFHAGELLYCNDCHERTCSHCAPGHQQAHATERTQRSGPVVTHIVADANAPKARCEECRNQFQANLVIPCQSCSRAICVACHKTHRCGRRANGSSATVAAPVRSEPATKAPARRYKRFSLDDLPKTCVRQTGDPELRQFLADFQSLKGDEKEGLAWPLSGGKAERLAQRSRIKGFLSRNGVRFASRSDEQWLYVWKGEPTSGRRRRRDPLEMTR